MIRVIKRDCSISDFNKDKITIAIEKAMKNGSGIYEPQIAKNISDDIENELKERRYQEMMLEDIFTKEEIEQRKNLIWERAIRDYYSDIKTSRDEGIKEEIDKEIEFKIVRQYMITQHKRNPIVSFTASV